jgi:hypothetical protein
MSLSMASRVSVPVDVLIQELNGESVILNVKTGRYFGLDGVGTRMWAVMTTSPSIAVACTNLLEEYEVQEEQLRQDLLEMAENLVANGLVEVHDQ